MGTDNNLADVIAELRERLVYLQELGVDGLGVAVGEAAMPSTQLASVSSSPVTPSVDPISNLRSEISDAKTEESSRSAGSRLASLPSLKERKAASFFDKYNPRDASPEVEVQSPKSEESEPPSNVSSVDSATAPPETIADIRAEIGTACTRCKLSQLGRTQVVNSVGNPNAELMFCGEAPGADEDRIGEPFVGRAGQLLTDIIEKGLGILRKDVFIGNINRCRPPGNRAPEPDESLVCKPFLVREIAVVQPKVIVVLGATAAQNLLETKTPIGKLRGKFHDFHGSKVMPTFHPAYLLRDPNKKREVWEDMKLVKEYLRNNRELKTEN
ncbi:MAG TPA: uracil-DNA glycosylase [Pyrinomonadaceae bacterium]